MTIPVSDYDKDAGLSGLQYRAEDNIIIESILTNNSDASLPPETFPFMWRVDLSRTPNVLQIRNPSNAAFLDFCEVTDAQVSLFSQGAAVPSLGAPQTFTAAQAVDISGSAGSLSVGSDLSSGIVARIPLFGHNSVGANVNGVNLVCRINTNTQGSEDFTFEVEVVRAGLTKTIAKLGPLSDFRTTGGDGIVDADTIRQAGITLAQIVREAKGRFGDGGNFSATFQPAQEQEGNVFRFNGSTNVFVDLVPLAEQTVMYFINESSGSASVTFRPATVGGVTDIRTSRLTLPSITGQAPMCAVYWYLSGGTRVNIFGNNV